MSNAAPPLPPLAPPGSQTPPGKTKKPFYKRKLVWLLAAIVVVILIVMMTKKESTPASTSSAPSATQQAGSVDAPVAAAPASVAPVVELAPAGPGVGTSVRDGKFEFVVSSVEPGAAEIGEAPLTTKAQGQFVVINVNVKNIGDEAQPFDGTSAKAFDSQGREFASSTAAAVYLPDSNSLFTPINPGNSVGGKIVFDVPADAKLTSVELHDSMFSDGVKVQL